MRAEIDSVQVLHFDDGTPVRAASAIAPLGEGWLIAQDDATHAAWERDGSVTAVRVLPPVDGHDTFSEAEGTKHLKPDFEAACEVSVDGSPAVLLLGSGSKPARMRGSLVQLVDGRPRITVSDLAPAYHRVAEVLGLPVDHLNLEGACRDGEVLRWFNRGNLNAGVESASVDVDFPALLAVVLGKGSAEAVSVSRPQSYTLGEVNGVGLAITDALALPDGRVLVSAAAEDTPNAVDDGPVVGAGLALLAGDAVLDVAALPEVGGTIHKVEGLALSEVTPDGLSVIGVVDSDDADAPSTKLALRVRW